MIKNRTLDLLLMVKDLIDPATRGWSLLKLEQLFYPADIEKIPKIKPAVYIPETWKYNRNGAFSVNSESWLASQDKHKDIIRETAMQASINEIKKQSWKLRTLPKIKMFLCKVVSDALPVADMIMTRGMKIDSRCQVCDLEGESINHVLFSCIVARQVWAVSNFPLPENGFSDTSIFQNMYYVLLVGKNPEISANIRKSSLG